MEKCDKIIYYVKADFIFFPSKTAKNYRMLFLLYNE